MGSRQRSKEVHRPRPKETSQPLPKKTKRTKPEQKLTLELLREGANWETAMVYPLPENPSLELLEEARLNVLEFLDMNSQKSIDTEKEITKTLKAGFEKLLEIAILLRQPLHDMGPLPDDEIPF